MMTLQLQTVLITYPNCEFLNFCNISLYVCMSVLYVCMVEALHLVEG
jgi:hypothetical protein